MGRAPCCAKMGLNKGPWSHDEDQILISYIQQHGHPNWRALPKQAGLLRCGKSCRLRWTNYLRPDIKRGNFSKEEEDTIIHLHETLGSRWSIVAAKLPGRTDNEIKNVWHTHLKKRLESHQMTTHVSKKRQTKSKCASKATSLEDCIVTLENNSINKERLVSNRPSSSESSTVTEATTDSSVVVKHEEINHETFLDDNFWIEVLSGKGDDIAESNPTTNISLLEFPTTPFILAENSDNKNLDARHNTNGMNLWYDIFTRVEELPELPEF